MTTQLRGVIWAAAFCGLVGCAKQDPEEQCQLPNDGPKGPCCEIRLANGSVADGACIDNRCTNGTVEQVNETCGEGGPAGPGGGRDSGRMILGDAGGPAGPGGGPGGPGSGGAGGGAGGEGGGGPAGPGGPGGQGGAGGGVDPCAEVVCDIDQRCDPVTGQCTDNRAAGPADPCAAPAECPDGECLTEEASMGGIPGGFCRVECAGDADCGAGRRCLPNADSTICFASCDGDCRDGWTCAGLDDGSGSVCLPDCRVTGCGAGSMCDDSTGLCVQACPYDCAAGEQCRGGRCIRDNGTCVTDYHCEVDVQQCNAGQCVRAEFSDCSGAADPPCHASQICTPRNPMDPAAGGLCLFSCVDDNSCAADRSCYTLESGSVCYYSLCGVSQMNGDLYGACTAGSMQQFPGTCLPLAVGDPAAPTDFGLCLEAGSAAEGDPCDDQTDGRDANARALQCTAGALCFNDPDDPLDPARDWANRGECAGLCDPRAGACSAGRTCIDFSGVDDAATPDFDETRYIGLCLQSDCTVAQDACGDGRHCRPFSLIAEQGRCGASGGANLGEPCALPADCADHAFCGNAGAGPTCLKICAEMADCAANEACVQNEGWAYGVCLLQ